MNKHRSHNVSWFPYLVSFLILTSISVIIFGGFKGLFDYKKSVEADLELDLNNLRFFTKEYLLRNFQRITVEDLPQATTLPSFYLYTDEQSLVDLNADLPASGKLQSKQGFMHINDPEFTSEVQFRYRGGLALHWLYKKKSYRVNLPPYKTYRGERKFNLVNPSTIATVTDWISYEMAETVGLLTPEFFPARVFINNNYNGLHFYLSKIDESLLRKKRRMPGSIYSGDTVYVENPFGADSPRQFIQLFYDGQTGIPRMWKDVRLWDKDSSRNAESKESREDLEKFLEIINDQDPLAFMRGFESYFDKEKFYLFWGLDTIVGGFHHDLYHNHKIYFDPYKGRFEPIAWDVRYWSPTNTQPEYPLLKQVKLNPILEFERTSMVYQLLQKFPVDSVKSRVSEMNKILKPEIKADPYRQQPDGHIKKFNSDKEMPYSIKEYEEAVEDLVLTYKFRNQMISFLLEANSIKYQIKQAKDDSIKLIFQVYGNSALDVDLWSIIPDKYKSNVKIERNLGGVKHSEVSLNARERLYPGKRIVQGTENGNVDNWTIFGKEHLLPSVLDYEYRIFGVDLSELNDISLTPVLNAITRKKVAVELDSSSADSSNTASVHPWEFLSERSKKSEKITLSGLVDVNENLVFSKDTLVTILPGTTFKLAKEKSVMFFGKVTAIGSPSRPIVFEQKVPGQFWGSLVVQGAAASGSNFKHIRVSGGSITQHKLINYPGEFNIHDVDDFTLEHCSISGNSVGDDALHVSYSKGKISYCRFFDTAFDALDMDIVDVTVSNSEFTNVGNDALDLMTSKVDVEQVIINGAGDKCFSLGENSDVTISNSLLKNCLIGIAVKDESHAYIENLSFEGIKGKAIDLYQKNSRYGKGGEINGRQLFGVKVEDVAVSEESKNLIPIDQFMPIAKSIINGQLQMGKDL